MRGTSSSSKCYCHERPKLNLSTENYLSSAGLEEHDVTETGRELKWAREAGKKKLFWDRSANY